MKKYSIFCGIALVVLILDQLTKVYFERNYTLGQFKVLIENHLYLTHVRNPGAAFGILADSPWRLPFFLTVALIAVVGILWYLRSLPATARGMHFSLGLIFGGAIGNVIDRIRLGEVVDFIGVHWYQYHWPAFNVADSAISVGVAILLIVSLQEELAQRRQRNATPQD
ncbi:signal peptidase II [Pelovirga terrestris]|uniref:Lipoprotein signal peptidase n=1 Tax=Pelovirga terrestris TaxID=2771352 RepID=A0A8J6UL18_9BACT|nr:signal peptidase II [Pelovirga terrestris]MBD1400412.1 signal peptidase II [Pelovirga terrestris]